MGWQRCAGQRWSADEARVADDGCRPRGRRRAALCEEVQLVADQGGEDASAVAEHRRARAGVDEVRRLREHPVVLEHVVHERRPCAGLGDVEVQAAVVQVVGHSALREEEVVVVVHVGAHRDVGLQVGPAGGDEVGDGVHRRHVRRAARSALLVRGARAVDGLHAEAGGVAGVIGRVRDQRAGGAVAVREDAGQRLARTMGTCCWGC